VTRLGRWLSPGVRFDESRDLPPGDMPPGTLSPLGDGWWQGMVWQD